MKIYQDLQEIFEKVLNIRVTESNINEDFFSISTISSLEFILLIVEIETRFDITLDDEFLNMERVNTFEKIYNIIKGIHKDEKNLKTNCKI